LFSEFCVSARFTAAGIAGTSCSRKKAQTMTIGNDPLVAELPGGFGFVG
jgi:hypothetical protein